MIGEYEKKQRENGKKPIELKRGSFITYPMHSIFENRSYVNLQHNLITICDQRTFEVFVEEQFSRQCRHIG